VSRSRPGVRQHDVTMDPSSFEAERSRLIAIATRILDSTVDADDVVQQARIRHASASDIVDVPAWLTTVVTRLCLDQLRKRRTRDRTETDAPVEPAVVDPEADTVLAEQIGGAMQIVLDTLAPAERAAFVLHDIFGYSFDEIGAILGRSGTAVRQLASRARRKVQGGAETPAELAARAESRRVVDAFLTAARGGDLATLLSLLAPGVVMRADLVGQQMGTAASYDGAAAVAERFNGARGAAPVDVDGERAAAWIAAGEVKVAFLFHVEAGHIHEVELIADPDVLTTFDVSRVRTTKGVPDEDDDV
jgi:RNA polymerase sigma factor (sigma-70 family)